MSSLFPTFLYVYEKYIIVGGFAVPVPFGHIVADLVDFPFADRIVAAPRSFVVTAVGPDLQLDSFELMLDYFEHIGKLDLKFELLVE